MADPKEPKGGFKEGGWYEGRQFFGGKFGDPGVINNPNQQGFGQKVSDEVNRQSSLLQTPGNPNSVRDYLAKYQKNVRSNLPAQIDNTGGSAGQVAQAVNTVNSSIVQSEAPKPPNSLETYNALRDKFNMGALTQQMSDLTKKKNDLITQLKTARNQTEHTRGITADVVSGRESEQQRQAQIQMEAIDMEISTVTTQIDSANSTIKMMMDFQQKDYENTRQSYEDQFNHAMALEDLGMKQKQLEMEQEKLVSEEKRAAMTQSIELARLGLEKQAKAGAQWKVLADTVMSGGIDPSALSPTQKQFMDQMDVNYGYPKGTLRSLHFATKNDTAQILSKDAVTGDVVMRFKDGHTQTVNVQGKPTKIGNAYYTYDASTGTMQALSGQGWFGTDIGVTQQLQLNGQPPELTSPDNSVQLQGNQPSLSAFDNP